MNYSLYSAQRLGEERRRDAHWLAQQERLARLASGQRGVPRWRLLLASLLRKLADGVANQPTDIAYRRYPRSAGSHTATG